MQEATTVGEQVEHNRLFPVDNDTGIDRNNLLWLLLLLMLLLLF